MFIQPLQLNALGAICGAKGHPFRLLIIVVHLLHTHTRVCVCVCVCVNTHYVKQLQRDRCLPLPKHVPKYYIIGHVHGVKCLNKVRLTFRTIYYIDYNYIIRGYKLKPIK